MNLEVIRIKLAKLVLPGASLLRQLQTSKEPVDAVSALLNEYVMKSVDYFNLSEEQLVQFPLQMRWQMIDEIEQQIKAHEELQKALKKGKVKDFSISNEIVHLKALKLRIWLAIFPKFNNSIKLAVDIPLLP